MPAEPRSIQPGNLLHSHVCFWYHWVTIFRVFPNPKRAWTMIQDTAYDRACLQRTICSLSVRGEWAPIDLSLLVYTKSLQ